MSNGKISVPRKKSKMNKDGIHLSVVFSFFNEEKVLPKLLTRVRNALDKDKNISSYELIFVNDNSTDNSREMLEAEAKNSGDVILINTSRNFGYSECYYAGFSFATGDALVYMDADLQDPPELIPQMVSAFCSDPEIDVVFTTRKTRAGESAIKLWITKVGYLFIRLVSNIDIPRDSGDFKLISRKVRNLLLNHEEKLPYMRGLISYYGFKQKQIFYDREARFDGAENTKFPVLSKRVMYYWLDNAMISFSDAPLKISLFTGFAIAIVAVLYLLIVIVQKILGWHVPGWPALMAVALILGATQLIMLGLFGLYLKSIFLEVKKRPNYVVSSVVTREGKKTVEYQFD